MALREWGPKSKCLEVQLKKVNVLGILLTLFVSSCMGLSEDEEKPAPAESTSTNSTTPTTFTVSIALPEGYTLTSSSENLTSLTKDGVTTLKATVSPGTQVQLVASSSCYADISYDQIIQENTATTLEQGTSKLFQVSFSSNLSGTTYDQDNPVTLSCGDYTVTASHADYADMTKSFSVSGSNIEVSFDYITASATFPTHSYHVYASHMSDWDAARTVNFVHNADRIECSHDAGYSYSSCDSSSSVLFTADDWSRNVYIYVKFVKSGYDDTYLSFRPRTQFANRYFYDCDQTVTSSESFNTFESRVNAASAGDVICINAGVDFSDDGDATNQSIDVQTRALRIIGEPSDRPVFTNSQSNGGPYSEQVPAFITSEIGMTFAHIETSSDGWFGTGIWLQTNNAGVSDDVIDNVKLVTQNRGYGLWIQGARNVQVTDSIFRAEYDNSSGVPSLYFTPDSTDRELSVTNSTIYSKGWRAYTQSKGTSEFTNSTFQAARTASATTAISVDDGVATISNSTIDVSYSALIVDGTANVTINNSSIRQAYEGPFPSGYPLWSDANTTVVSGSGNTVCRLGSVNTNRWWSDYYNNTGDFSGVDSSDHSWVAANSVCP